MKIRDELIWFFYAYQKINWFSFSVCVSNLDILAMEGCNQDENDDEAREEIMWILITS